MCFIHIKHDQGGDQSKSSSAIFVTVYTYIIFFFPESNTKCQQGLVWVLKAGDPYVKVRLPVYFIPLEKSSKFLSKAFLTFISNSVKYTRTHTYIAEEEAISVWSEVGAGKVNRSGYSGAGP